MELFMHLPPAVRQTASQAVKGQTAVKFPAGFSLKHNKHWTIVSPADAAGMVIKTNPEPWMVKQFVDWLVKHNIEHEIFVL